MKPKKEELLSFIKETETIKKDSGIFPFHTLDLDLYHKFTPKYDRSVINDVLSSLCEDGVLFIGDAVNYKYFKIIG